MRVGVIALLMCLTLACFSGAIAQDQAIITNGLTQIAEELCKDDGRLFYFPDGLGWQVYGIGYSQPMWIDLSEYPSLQELKSNAISSSNQCVLAAPLYGVQPLHVTVTLDLLSGDLVLRPGCSSEELANVSAPSGYQPSQWPANCRVVERLWQQWQKIQSDADWQEWYGSDANPFLTFHFQFADLIDEKPVYDETLVAEEMAWEEAQATVSDAQTGMLTAMTEGEGGGEFEIESVSPCTITNLTQPFVIISIQQDTNLYTAITWESCPIFRYLVLSANELRTNTAWLPQAYTWGNTNATSWTDTTTTTNVAHRFYKVQRILGSPIAAGDSHSLLVLTNSTLWAWGRDTEHQLGDGATDDQAAPVPLTDPVCGPARLTNAVVLAGGYEYSAAVDANGVVWSWGDGYYGQLGNGGNTNVSTPSPINGISNVVNVAGGADHTLALRADGTVWAWGKDEVGDNDGDGQLGAGYLGGATSTNTPIQSLLPGGTVIVAIAAGTFFSLALDTTGSVWGWGGNIFDQLGTNVTSAGGSLSTNLPTLVAGISNVIAIAAGVNHSVAITADKRVWTWGGNGAGQLGRSGTGALPAPAFSNTVAIAAGSSFTLAVTSSGQVYAWGSNIGGQLGTNGIDFSYTPIPVAGVSNAVLVSAHSQGSHSLAITVNQGTNQYYGWGANSEGQVGNGSGDIAQYTPALLHFCDACASCVPLGTGGVFTAQCTGTLKLYFNDSLGAYTNNSGSYTARVFGVSSTNVVVLGNNGQGVTVGVVTKGSNYTYTASGFCSWGAGEADPDGNDTEHHPTDCSATVGILFCPNTQCFSLVGRIQ